MWTIQIFAGLLIVRAAFSLSQPNSPGVDAYWYPYMVSIQKHHIHWCSGSVIHPTWVLTAAHCVVDFRVFEFLVEFSTGSPSWHNQETVKLKRIIAHDEYDENNLNNDIALLELSDMIYFEGRPIAPVQLPASHFEIKLAEKAELFNWGSWQELSISLTKMYVEIYPDAKCKKRHNITDDQICGDGTCGVGLCSGHSGDPLLLNSKQIGIASSHKGIFTKVSHYIEWIRKNIKQSQSNVRSLKTKSLKKLQ